MSQWDNANYSDPGSQKAPNKQNDKGKARHGTQAPPGQEPGDTGPKNTQPTEWSKIEWASLSKRIPAREHIELPKNDLRKNRTYSS